MTMKPPPLYVTTVLGFAKLGLQEMMLQELYFHPSSDVLDIRSAGTKMEALSGLGGWFGLGLVFGFFFETLDVAVIKYRIYSGKTPIGLYSLAC